MNYTRWLLQAADIMNDMALAPLARSLKLIIAIQEVAATNKVLKAEWSKREVPVLKMVRDLASVRIGEYFSFLVMESDKRIIG